MMVFFFFTMFCSRIRKVIISLVNLIPITIYDSIFFIWSILKWADIGGRNISFNKTQIKFTVLILGVFFLFKK